MDHPTVLAKLEEAARVLLAPPNLVTSEQRHQAESTFLEFKKFSFPYETCRFILEHSKNDYAQFQAAATIKTSIVREWTSLSSQDVEQLRIFLLNFVTSHLSLQQYVREEIFQTVAVILKRGILEKDSPATERIFDEVTQLISTGDLTMQLLACSLLTALLNEFSSNAKSSGAGFTWEFHIRCKQHFESNKLLQTLHFTLQVLNELIKCPTPLNRSQLPVMMRFLSISEHILCWEFLPVKLTRRHMVPFGSFNQPSFRPPVAWRDTVLNPELIDMFIKLYIKMHYHGEMCYIILQCLGQLASLNGVVFSSEDSQLQYLTNFTSKLVNALKSVELKDYDALGISNIFENLLRWFKIESFAKLPSSDVLDPLLKWMTQLTCQFISSAASTERAKQEDNIYNEALEKMLFSWTTLLTDSADHFSLGHFRKQATEIFNIYVQCHLSDSQGSSGSSAVVDEEEYEEDEEEDRDLYSEHLASIGVIGREVIEHSLHTLARLVDERIERLKSTLEMVTQRVTVGQSLHELSSSPHLISIFEDLHWLIMIATCILTDNAEGELALIPTSVMKVSISQANTVDQQLCKQAIQNPSQSAVSNKLDCVLRLLSSILRLLQVESLAATSNLGYVLSPQMDSTCMWFLQRFVETYVVPPEDSYAQISLTYSTVFGDHTEPCISLINQIIDAVRIYLSIWNSEPTVVRDSLNCLVTVVSKTRRCGTVIQSTSFWNFMTSVSENLFPFNILPSSARRPLYKAVVYSSTSMTEQRQQYWQKMVHMPMTRFAEFVNSMTFKQKRDDPEVKETLLSYLEILIGCCQATRLSNHEELFNVVEPSLTVTIQVLDICHTNEQIVQLCLEVFSEVVRTMITSLDNRSSERLYEHCLAAIHMYAKYHSGVRTVEVDAEEDKFRDILLILELLLNLMSKDLIDFGVNGVEETCTISATEVVLFGLTVLVPLMDASLLQFPSLCTQYFKLLAFISEMRPDKILELSDPLLSMILSSVQLSLTQYGSDVAKSGFEFLTEIAMYIVQQSSNELLNKSRLDAFLEPVLNLILFEPFDIDLLDVTSGCLFYLIIMFPVKYKELESVILEQQKAAAHYKILVSSFAELATAAQTSGSTNYRQRKIAFMETMNKFLLEVKGYLCVR